MLIMDGSPIFAFSYAQPAIALPAQPPHFSIGKHRQSADNTLDNRLIPLSSMVWRAYRVRDSVLRKW